MKTPSPADTLYEIRHADGRIQRLNLRGAHMISLLPTTRPIGEALTFDIEVRWSGCTCFISINGYEDARELFDALSERLALIEERLQAPLLALGRDADEFFNSGAQKSD